jgi:hypothetical protein
MASNFAGRSVRVTLKNREQLQGTVRSATGGLLTLTDGEFCLREMGFSIHMTVVAVWYIVGQVN